MFFVGLQVIFQVRAGTDICNFNVLYLASGVIRFQLFLAVKTACYA